MTNTGVARRVFGNDKPPDIIRRLKILYVTSSLQEIDQDFLRLHNPMDQNQPVEVMIRNTKEFQMFPIMHPYRDLKLSDINFISYVMIKLSKCGGLYTKAVEWWKRKTTAYKNIWANFRQHLIAEYEKLLAKGVITTFAQEGYGTIFNATEGTTDNSSITESIVL